MKIISGYRGGQFIKVPKTIKVRPTTGKSKEGIFNGLDIFDKDFKRMV